MPALVSPFDETGELLVADHRHNIATLASRGVAGFLVGGSTGEGPYLEPGERSTLVAVARDEAPDAFVLCGVAGQSVRQARDQVREAADAGADAALVLTPASLVLGDDAATADFYRELAADSPLPLLLYTIRRVTGYVLPVEIVVALASLPGVIGIKDSNGDPERIAAMRDGLGTLPFLIYAGATRAISASMKAGGTGAITASANYAFDLVRAVVAEPLGASQAALTELSAAIEAHGLAGTKAAATRSGLRAGVPRAPLRALDAAGMEAVEEALLNRVR